MDAGTDNPLMRFTLISLAGKFIMSGACKTLGDANVRYMKESMSWV
jgi:hypothetical protein